MGAELKSTSHDRTLVLTLSNPGLRNALGPEMYAAGFEALSAAERNPDIGCVVLTGEGGAFCAGGNLHRLAEKRLQDPTLQAQSIEGLHDWIEAIRSFPKPVIAAVEGAAAGAGFSLALACDLLVAASDAVFTMAYTTVALSPDGGGSWALSRLLPRQLASELMLTGQRVGATRLHALGVVNQLSTPGQALQDALALAHGLNGRAANALASVKELVNAAPASDLHTHLKLERDHFVRNLRHPNAGIGIAAFLQKTVPHYPPQ